MTTWTLGFSRNFARVEIRIRDRCLWAVRLVVPRPENQIQRSRAAISYTICELSSVTSCPILSKGIPVNDFARVKHLSWWPLQQSLLMNVWKCSDLKCLNSLLSRENSLRLDLSRVKS